MLGVREFVKLVCSCAICHASASDEIPYGTQKKCCCTGSLAQIRALTRDGPLDKAVNGNLVPSTLFSLRSTVSNTKDTREVLISLLFLTLLLNYANSNVTVVLTSG